MARLFGTDGVRGLANRDLTVELALGIAQSAAVVLGKLKVYAGDTHPHAAQQPVPFEISQVAQ